MGIGICCQWLSPTRQNKDGEVLTKNLVKEKALQLGKYNSGQYSESFIKSVYANNISGINNIIPVILSFGIKHFRISSSMLPLMDKVPKEYWDNSEIISALNNLGDNIRQSNIRISTHPGQFTVLSSEKDHVVDAALSEIENQSWIFDRLGLEPSTEYSINVHGGKSGRSDALVDAILRLSKNARSRLTLENDESAYSIKQLLDVSKRTGVPIVFDSHHHTFNSDGMTGAEAAEAAMNTWPPWIRPIQHLSNTEPGLENASFTDRRKHSYNLHYIPDFQRDMLNSGQVDIEMEFKGKNLGVLPNLEKLGINLTSLQ